MGRFSFLTSVFAKKPCPLCLMKDEYLETLKCDLREAQKRERAAIDRLLTFQGKPTVSTQTMDEDSMNAMFNPFAEVPVESKDKKWVMPGIFEDMLKAPKT